MSKFEIMQQSKVNQEFAQRFKLNEKGYHGKWYEKLYQGIVFDGSIFFATVMFVGLVFYTGENVISGALLYNALRFVLRRSNHRSNA